MAVVNKVLSAAVLLAAIIPLAYSQDAVTTIQLPNGTITQLTFTTIDVPGAGVTGVTGINAAGDMVGTYREENGKPTHGFLLRAGVFTFFDYPGAENTVPNDINDSGLIVGYAEFNGGLVVHGFLYDGRTFAPFDAPGQPETYAIGINNAGQVVGHAGSTFSITRPFEMSNGRFRLLRVPGRNQVAGDINNTGKIAGFIPYPTNKGFAYAAGESRSIVFPGAQNTEAWGINDNGLIIGWYGIGALVSGFALSNGQYATFSFPGAQLTLPLHVNASGQAVGAYSFDGQNYHGFVTSPIAAPDNLGGIPFPRKQ